MTPNFDRWRFITKELGAPAQFLEFAFYAGVSTALERRVFYGDLNRPLFLNTYLLLVGPAGVGKGQSMREVRRIVGSLARLGEDGKPMLDKRTLEPVTLFNSLADTMTFEAVVDEMARVRSHVKRPGNDGIYEHSSFYVYLEELSSFLRINKADDVARLLLNLYDSSEPFRYRTKKSGSHEIRNGCLNLIAGTTLDFLAKAEQSGLVGEGLFSRMMVVYAEHREHDRFEQHVLSKEQLAEQVNLQKHFFRLGHLFGPVRYSPETLVKLEAWWDAESKHLMEFGDEKLANYFSRRKVQVMKLAAAIHFSENLTFEIPWETFEKAAKMVRSLEDPIIRLARRTGKNVQFNTVERFVARLARQGAMTNGEAISWLSSDMDMPDILSTLQLLTDSGRIVLTPNNVWMLAQPSNTNPAQSTSPAATLNSPPSSPLPQPNTPTNPNPGRVQVLE